MLVHVLVMNPFFYESSVLTFLGANTRVRRGTAVEKRERGEAGQPGCDGGNSTTSLYNPIYYRVVSKNPRD
jgi:hypothetical protein